VSAATLADPADVARVHALRERHRLRDYLLGRSTLPRIGHCGRHRRAGQSVSVQVRETGSSIGGVQSCGSIWACAVCSAKIRQGRAGEIETAAGAHLTHALEPKQIGPATRYRRGGLTFATLTMRHQYGDDLGQLLDVLMLSWSQVQTSAAWRRAKKRYRLVGQIRSLEITLGGSGWHPHLHLLLFTSVPLHDDETDELGNVLFATWAEALASYGATCERVGFDCQPVRKADDVARYVAKVQDEFGNERGLGLELSRHDLKTGRRAASRTPFQLLADASRSDRDDTRDLALWREYERATKGRRAIEFSRGLRGRLALPEVSDQDLADAEADQVVAVVPIDPWTWSQLVLPVAGRRVALVVAADKGGEVLVRRLLQRWHLQRRRRLRPTSSTRTASPPATAA
jgi:hypothetical protein